MALSIEANGAPTPEAHKSHTTRTQSTHLRAVIVSFHTALVNDLDH